jgi:hypothetical protein
VRASSAARRIGGIAVAALIAIAAPVRSAEDPRLRPGAIEAGFSASTSTIEGNTRGVLSIRGGTFLPAPGGLASLQLETSYSHVQSLDELGLEAAAGWLTDDGHVLPFVAVAAGVRQEWIGSFREARFPVGADLGVRLLLSPRVAIRAEYRVRRVLGDTVADFTEHRFVTGFSVFWNNED